MFRTVSIIINAIIFLDMVVLTVLFFRKDGKWAWANGKRPLKYFTFESNVLCAIASLLMIFLPEIYPVWIIKFVATVAVTVTMVTVLVFLGPAIGYRRVFSKHDFWMHLVNPILALVSFCIFERGTMPFVHCLFGIIPVVLYAIMYGYKVMLAKEEKRWEDFYGFNKGGKWYISVILLPLGAFLISVGLWAIQLL